MAIAFFVLGIWLLIISTFGRTVTGLDLTAAYTISTVSIAIAIFVTQFAITLVEMNSTKTSILQFQQQIGDDIDAATDLARRHNELIATNAVNYFTRMARDLLSDP